jgi:hypothetical protein
MTNPSPKTGSATKKPSPPLPPPPSARRTDAALRPATALEVMVSRALDQELGWYFEYAEGALARESVGLLPSYAAVRVLATEPTDEACRTKAAELAQSVRGCVGALGARHASVLRAAYTPRRWPKSVENTFASLAPLVVRLAFAEDPWPARSARAGLEEAAAVRLGAAIVGKARVPVARWRAQAERLLGAAVAAYANERAQRAPALPLA